MYDFVSLKLILRSYIRELSADTTCASRSAPATYRSENHFIKLGSEMIRWFETAIFNSKKIKREHSQYMCKLKNRSPQHLLWLMNDRIECFSFHFCFFYIQTVLNLYLRLNSVTCTFYVISIKTFSAIKSWTLTPFNNSSSAFALMSFQF